MAMTLSEARKKYGSITSGSGASGLSVTEVLENRRKRLKQEQVERDAELIAQNKQNYQNKLNAAIQERKNPANESASEFDYDRVSKQDDFVSTAVKGYRADDNKLRKAYEAEPELKKFLSAEEVYEAGYDLKEIDRTLSAASQEQKALYNYYMGLGDKEKADRYLDSIYQDLQKQYNQGYAGEISDFAEEHPVMGSVASVISGIYKPLGIASDIGNKMQGDDINTESKWHVGSLATDAFRSGAKENINSDAGKFLYDTAMSGADSLAMAPLGGVGAAMLGAGAASDAVIDAKDRGATDGQAIAQGLAQGVAEGLFEKFSIGNLKGMKDVPVNSVKDALKNTAKSMGINASEEAFTEIANSITDSLIMGDNSNFDRAVAAYQKAGMPGEKAILRAMTDTVQQVVLAGLGGALMGGAFAGVGAGSHYVEANKLGSQMTDADLDYAIQSGRYLNNMDSSKIAEDIQARRENGQKVSNYQKGNLVHTVAQDQAEVAKEIGRTFGKVEKNIRKHGAQDSPVLLDPEEGQKELDVEGFAPEETRALSEEELNELGDRYVHDFRRYYSENGAAEMEESWTYYRGKIGADQYEDGFSSAYRAGLTGAVIPQTVNTALLDNATLQIAYNSGKADAILNQARAEADARKMARFVSMQNEGGGIVASDSAKSMMESDLEQFDAVDVISKAVGIKVNIVDTLGDANGMYKDGAITIARDSNLEAATVLKHELTHAMQEYSADAYAAYKDFVVSSILEYDKSGLDEAVQGYISRYAENNIDLTYDEAFDELVSDASERFLNDEVSIRQFVSTLKESDRSFVQKIVDFFKELVDKLTKAISDADPRTRAGELLNESLVTAKKAEKLWQQGLAHMGESVAGKKEVKRYSLKEYSEHTKENWKNSKRIVVYESKEQLADFIELALRDKNFNKKMYFGAVSHELASEILEKTGVEVEGYNFSLQAAEVRKIFKDHGSADTELSRGQRAVTKADILNIVDVLESPDSIEYAGLYEGHETIKFQKELNGKTTVVAYAIDKRMDLTVQTMYAGMKKRNLAAPVDEQASPIRPERGSGTVSSDNSISQLERNDNTKYSLKDTSEVDVKKLQQENDHLKELNENLRAQFRLTKEFTPNRKELTAAAKRILTDYNSSYDPDTLVDNMESIYKYIANNQIDSEESVEITNAFASIAKKVLEKSGQLDTSLYDAYADLRSYLRSTNIKITPEMKSEIDGYSDIRRAYLGSVKMVNEGTEIDSIYSELVGMYPNLFDESITDPVEQLYEIMDVSDSLKPTFRQMDGVSLNETAAILGRELFDSYFDVALNKPTLADKHKQEISRIKAENRKKIGEVKAKLRADHILALQETKQRYQGRIDRKEEKLLAQKKHYRDMQENARNRKTVSTLRRHITKNVGKLREKLMANTETKHIPATLRGPVLELLSALDFNTGKTARDGGESSFNQKLTKLHSAYVSLLEQEYEYGFTLDEDLKVKLAELKEVTEGKAVRQLDRSELETVDEIVTEILHAVNTANKLFKDGRKADLDAVGTRALGELEQKKEWSRLRVVPQGVSDFINSSNITPPQMFDRIGGTLQEYYQEIRRGEGNYIRLVVKAQEYSKDIMKKYNYKEWGTGKKSEKQKAITLFGGTVHLTVGELMYIYTASQREQARAHMVGENAGGITPTSVVKHGITEKANPTAVKLTEADLEVLIFHLTDEQKAFADEMRDYLAKDCAEQGNEVTMAMYGIRKFGEQKYIPIVTDPNFLYEKAGVADDARIKHSGFTKTTVANANTPIQAVDFMKVWAKHVGDMAMYNSFVRQLDDFQRVWNYKVKGEQDKSVKAALNKTLGKRVNSYIKQLLTDINGGVKADQNEKSMAKLFGMMKKSAVLANLRVVVQQPSAIGRAFAEINPMYFANFKKPDYAELEKYVPQATLKKMGYFDTDMGGSIVQNLITQDLTNSRWEKAKDIVKNEYGTRDDAFSYLAEKADEVTWAAIWNAVKNEVKHTTNLEVGSQEYWNRCEERMVEVIDKTQVMDSVFQRSQVMRSKHLAVKMATSFMSEPTKTYNMIWRAVTKIYDGDKDAWKNLLRTMIFVAVTEILNESLSSLVDAMRDEEYEDYWDKWMNAFMGGMLVKVKNDEDDWKDWALLIGMKTGSMVPYVRDVLSMFEGYSVKRTDMTVLEDVVRAVKAIANEEKEPKEKIEASLKAISHLTGVPASNIYRDGMGAKRTIDKMINDYLGVTNYELRKRAFLEDNELSEGKDVSKYYDILFESVEQGEAEFREMVKYGLDAKLTQDGMYQAINNRFKKKYNLMVWQAVKNYKAGNAREYNDIVAFLEAQGYSKTNTINKVMGNVLDKINAGESAPEQVSVDDVVGSYYTEDEINSFEDNYDELYEAYAAGDSRSYTEMYTRLKEGGKTDAAIKTAMTTRRRKAVEESKEFQDLITCCMTGNGDYTVYYSKLVQNYPIKMPMDEKRADVAALVLRSEIWTKFKEAALADDREGMKKYGRYLAPITQMSLSELRKKAIK